MLWYGIFIQVKFSTNYDIHLQKKLGHASGHKNEKEKFQEKLDKQSDLRYYVVQRNEHRFAFCLGREFYEEGFFPVQRMSDTQT